MFLEDGIAIIGFACRFPGADDYQSFWQNLVHGVNSVCEITPDRFDINSYYSINNENINKTASKWAGLINYFDLFDNQFFNISSTEARVMDPQQRILLEETWHCIEDAGVTLRDIQQAKTSVHVGVMAIDYQYHVTNLINAIDGYSCLGNYGCILSNRISHFLDLTGESKTIDTACSSSLVALHDARHALLSRQSDYGIVAGVNIICHPWKYISFSKAHMLSPDGQCKTFDTEANGYVPGEGVGVLLLTSLKNAVLKGHRIVAILKGSAVQHSGKTRSITAPRVMAQQRVIEAALSSASVNSEFLIFIWVSY